MRQRKRIAPLLLSRGPFLPLAPPECEGYAADDCGWQSRARKGSRSDLDREGGRWGALRAWWRSRQPEIIMQCVVIVVPIHPRLLQSRCSPICAASLSASPGRNVVCPSHAHTREPPAVRHRPHRRVRDRVKLVRRELAVRLDADLWWGARRYAARQLAGSVAREAGARADAHMHRGCLCYRSSWGS